MVLVCEDGQGEETEESVSLFLEMKVKQKTSKSVILR